MVFSSFEFLFFFLPAILAGTWVTQRFGDVHVKVWLIAASLAFYAAWYPPYLFILLSSIFVNYGLLRAALAQDPSSKTRFWIVAIGVAANVGLLASFKYLGFIAFNINAVFDAKVFIPHIVLPLGISFFTFQKIALLVDVYRRDVKDVPLLSYMMFVTFFPQLIAGPIVLFPEVQDQYREPGRLRLTLPHFALGLSVFAVGLFKKTALADLVASYASAVFTAAAQGKAIGTGEAWIGVLGYTLQIYFDFSGYSDMAVGLAAMFGILLPFNFASPYRATSIIEFWRRWHITLSRFLRVYLYIPLGGNRSGPLRRYVNLLTVMLIGGLWHGAAWTFVIWGGLHGLYLVVNHLWRSQDLPAFFGGRAFAVFCWLLTFLAVNVAWVFFRADTFEAAVSLLHSMFDLKPSTDILNRTLLLQTHDVSLQGALLALLAGLAICVAMPNTQAFFARRLELTLNGRDRGAKWSREWKPSPQWAVLIGLLIGASILAMTKGTSPFLYFNF